MESTDKSSSEGMIDAFTHKWDYSSDYSNTIALYASLVSVHVWRNQADHVRLVRAKLTSARLYLEHLVCSQCLTCRFTLIRDRLTKDDPIGTAFLNLSTMSSSGGEIEGNNRSDYRCGNCLIVLYQLNVPFFFFNSTETDERTETSNSLSECMCFMVVGINIVKKKTTLNFKSCVANSLLKFIVNIAKNVSSVLDSEHCSIRDWFPPSIWPLLH